jgi:hypothetical protein
MDQAFEHADGGEKENCVELLLGLSLTVASLLAFYVALPRGGQVAKFLRNDHVQSYFVVLVLGAFVIGSLSLVASLTGLDPFTEFK